MSMASATCETSRPTPHCLRRVDPGRGESAGSRTGALGLAPHPPGSPPPESRPTPELRIFGAGRDGTDDRAAATVLVIDEDSASTAEPLRRAFPAPAHRVQVAGNGPSALRHVLADAPDVIVLDPDHSGLEVYRQIRLINARVPVIFVTRARRADAAIEAMRQGAYDYLLKPFDLPKLDQVVGEALKVARLMRESAVVAEPAPDDELPGETIVGSCPVMCEVYKAIGRVAAQDVPVLITGETGTGKELVARAVYRHGPRANAPFLAINCAAIPENLLESELFGHEKGAFTGADRRRIGKFEQANGGTLFLDEIGDMPPALQAKVLRVLQEQSFERVGGNETIRTDVRLIAGTHHDLKRESAEGKFRADLYYRLGVFAIHLPPLRQRGDDLPALVHYFVRRFSKELGREVREVATEVLRRLCARAWRGNIRELQSVLKQALLRASGPVLLPAFLPELPEEAGEPVPSSPAEDDARAGTFVIRQRLGDDVRDLYAEAHRQLDQQLLPRVLEHTGGSQHRAALLLGIARQTLRLKLRDLGLAPT